MKTLLALGLLLFSATAVEAEPIYRKIEPSGRITYQTSSAGSQAQAVKLPEVRKENLTKKLTEIRKEIPETCERHGGIDCAKGADSDASVICVDGYAGVRQNFLESCSTVRLELLGEEFVDERGAAIKKELLRPEAYGGKKPEKILISLRNLSAVSAKGVRVSGEVVKRKFPASGPAEIAPYGLERYEVPVDRERLPPFADFRTRYRSVVSCSNCLAVQKSRR